MFVVMSNLYKKERTCECGYNTLYRSNFHTHKKTHCKLLRTNTETDHIVSLKKQLAIKDQQLEAKDKQLEAKDQQLAAKDEQMKAKDEQINQLIQNANKRQKSDVSTERKLKMSEPQRRIIAAKQDWKCANPDGKCRLKDGYLEEYDVDHIIPLRIGGPDNPSNMQALCPACHRRKTERDVRLTVPETFEQLLETFQACGNKTSCQPCVS